MRAATRPLPFALTLTALAALGALMAGSLVACLVSVDESLIAKAASARADASNDADANADASDASAPDAGPYLGLPCGQTHCTPPGEVCCATKNGDPDIANGICSTKSLCRTGDWFACTSTRDCVGSGLGDLLCCAVHDVDAFNLTKCASACGATDSLLCEPGGRPCPSGQRCAPSTEFPKLYACAAL